MHEYIKLREAIAKGDLLYITDILRYDTLQDWAHILKIRRGHLSRCMDHPGSFTTRDAFKFARYFRLPVKIFENLINAECEIQEDSGA